MTDRFDRSFSLALIYINIVISLLLSIKLIPLLIYYVIVSVIVMRRLCVDLFYDLNDYISYQNIFVIRHQVYNWSITKL